MLNDIEENELGNYNLNRFVAAQENVYQTVIAELKNGNKQSHWMWFIFPQINGLGISKTAQFYAIKSMEEGRAYFNHALLGNRLLECSAVLLTIKNKSAEDIFSFPDYVKLQSCMTLFSILFPDQNIFKEVLEKYYINQMDLKTIEIVSQIK